MNKKFLFWMVLMTALTGIANAAGKSDWIKQNTKLFFIGMIAFGVVGVLMIVWEVIYLVTSPRGKMTEDKISIVSSKGQAMMENGEDPIKILLKEHVQKKDKPDAEKSSMPTFLSEPSDDPRKKAQSAAKTAAPPPPPPESAADDDPFKKLLHKTVTNPENLAGNMPGSPVKIKAPPTKSAPDASDDPFKSLLKSTKDGDFRPSSAAQPSAQPPAQPPTSEAPKPVGDFRPSVTKQPAPPETGEDDSFLKIMTPQMQQYPQESVKKEATERLTAPPEMQRDSYQQAPPSSAGGDPKKLSFKLPGVAKPKGAEKLFDRLAEPSKGGSPGSPQMPSGQLDPLKKIQLRMPGSPGGQGTKHMDEDPPQG